jgi:hypothetical protein
VPDLLSVQEPEIDLDESHSLKFVFEYDYLPRSIIPRFIVRMNRDIFRDDRWRTGVHLRSALFSAEAVVRADEKAKRIVVVVVGGQRRDYFANLRQALDGIHRTFEKLTVTELVPLPDRPNILLEYRELIGHEGAGREEIFVGRLGRGYPVKDLLNGVIEEGVRRSDRSHLIINVTGDYISTGTGGVANVVRARQGSVMAQTERATMSDERLQTLLAFAFGIVFILSVLALAVFIPHPSPEQFEVFRIVMALAAGGVAAVIPGLLHLNLSRGQGLAVRAGGALAVFVIVYFYSPARWAVQ